MAPLLSVRPEVEEEEEDLYSASPPQRAFTVPHSSVYPASDDMPASSQQIVPREEAEEAEEIEEIAESAQLLEQTALRGELEIAQLIEHTEPSELGEVSSPTSSYLPMISPTASSQGQVTTPATVVSHDKATIVDEETSHDQNTTVERAQQSIGTFYNPTPEWLVAERSGRLRGIRFGYFTGQAEIVQEALANPPAREVSNEEYEKRMGSWGVVIVAKAPSETTPLSQYLTSSPHSVTEESLETEVLTPSTLSNVQAAIEGTSDAEPVPQVFTSKLQAAIEQTTEAEILPLSLRSSVQTAEIREYLQVQDYDSLLQLPQRRLSLGASNFHFTQPGDDDGIVVPADKDRHTPNELKKVQGREAPRDLHTHEGVYAETHAALQLIKKPDPKALNYSGYLRPTCKDLLPGVANEVLEMTLLDAICTFCSIQFHPSPETPAHFCSFCVNQKRTVYCSTACQLADAFDHCSDCNLMVLPDPGYPACVSSASDRIEKYAIPPAFGSTISAEHFRQMAFSLLCRIGTYIPCFSLCLRS